MSQGWPTNKSVKTIALICAISIPMQVAVGHAWAQGVQDTPSGQDEIVDIDMFAPTGPALIALNAAPRRNAAPGSFKDVSFEFGNSGGGNIVRNGVAVTVIPYWMVDQYQTLDHYRTATSRLERLTARTQLGLGAAYSDREVDRIQVGLGVQTQLLDAQDHKFDEESYACIHRAWQNIRLEDGVSDLENIAETLSSELAENSGEEEIEIEIEFDDPIGSGDETSTRAYLSAVDACRTQSIGRLLANPSWLVGLGTGAAKEDVANSDWEGDGASVWTSVRLPIADRGRIALLGFLRGDMDRAFDLRDDLRASGDALTVGAGGALQFSSFRLDLVADYNEVDFDQMVDGFAQDTFMRYSAIADIRLRRGLWIEISGGTINTSDLHDETFGAISLKVAWSDYISRIRNP